MLSDCIECRMKLIGTTNTLGCITCSSYYKLDITNGTCSIDCSSITDCSPLSCYLDTTGKLLCLSCESGKIPSSDSLTCITKVSAPSGKFSYNSTFYSCIDYGCGTSCDYDSNRQGVICYNCQNTTLSVSYLKRQCTPKKSLT